MKLTRLQAGSYITPNGKYSITEMEFEKGYWSIYKKGSHGDWDWCDVTWGLKAAKVELANLMPLEES